MLTLACEGKTLEEDAPFTVADFADFTTAAFVALRTGNAFKAER